MITNPIPRDTKKIPRRSRNAAAELISDTIKHYEQTQAAVARAMHVSPGLICDIINGRKGVSVDFALRFEQCLGVSAQWLLRLQSFHDYCVAHHSKRKAIAKDVRTLIPS